MQDHLMCMTYLAICGNGRWKRLLTPAIPVPFEEADSSVVVCLRVVAIATSRRVAATTMVSVVHFINVILDTASN